MTDSRNIPWMTISVEAVAVVMSILLAFSIDAWWTQKKENDLDTNQDILTALVKNHTFDPVSATFDALANDGRLALISDASLLAQLSNWQRSLDNIEDISFELRAESVRVRRAMERHGGPFARWPQRPDNPDVLQRIDGETMANMRLDVDFMGTSMSLAATK